MIIKLRMSMVAFGFIVPLVSFLGGDMIYLISNMFIFPMLLCRSDPKCVHRVL